MYEYLIALNESNNTKQKQVIHLKSDDGGLGSHFKKTSDILSEIASLVIKNYESDAVEFLIDATVISYNNKCKMEYFEIDSDNNKEPIKFQEQYKIDKVLCPKVIKLKKAVAKRDNWENVHIFVEMESGRVKAKYNYKD